jgi:hypothetical protein
MDSVKSHRRGAENAEEDKNENVATEHQGYGSESDIAILEHSSQLGGSSKFGFLRASAVKDC